MLDDLRIERYARHILLREVGGVGQEKILAAKVRIEGLDEAGCWAATYLALAGVGHLSLADPRPVPPGGLLPLLPALEEGARRDRAVAEAIPAFNPDTRVDAREDVGLGTMDGVCRIDLAGVGGGTFVLATTNGRALGGWIDGPICMTCIGGERVGAAAPADAALASLAGSVAASEILAAILGAGPRPRGLSALGLGESSPLPPCHHGNGA